MLPQIIRSSSLAIFVAVLTLAGCKSDDPPGPVGERVTALRGVVMDGAGAPLSGVRVSSDGVSAATSADGRYQLLVTAGPHVVRFEKTDFVAGIERVDVVSESPTQLDVFLLALAPGMPLDATAGGTVTGARGTSLDAPAAAFVDRTGAAVTGMVTVHLTPVDPSAENEMRSAPGDFTAQTAAGRSMLESMGMMDITVRQDTETLEVAPGQSLQIRIPVPAAATAPDAMMGLWSFDEALGIWVDEGMAMYDAASSTYMATTTHMSMWNIDKTYLATCVCGTVVERGGGPLPGARVTSSGLDYFGTTDASTGATGGFCIAVRKDSRVSVAAYHASGGGTAREIMSGSMDTNVPVTGGAGCVDIGTFEVERDVFMYPDGTTTSCGEMGNPFMDACGMELWGVFECYGPMGACTGETAGTGTTITHANGSRQVSMFDAGASMISSELYGPTGTLCATMSAIISSDPMADVTFNYMTPAGRMFGMTVPGGDTGDMIISCPDGSMQVITPEARQALEACGSGGGGSMEMCTFGTPTAMCPGDCADMPGTMCCNVSGTGVCLEPADCAAASACTGVMCPAGEFCNPGTGECASVCDFLMCPAGQVCDAMMAMCVPG